MFGTYFVLFNIENGVIYIMVVARAIIFTVLVDVMLSCKDGGKNDACESVMFLFIALKLKFELRIEMQHLKNTN